MYEKSPENIQAKTTFRIVFRRHMMAGGGTEIPAELGDMAGRSVILMAGDSKQDDTRWDLNEVFRFFLQAKFYRMLAKYFRQLKVSRHYPTFEPFFYFAGL